MVAQPVAYAAWVMKILVDLTASCAGEDSDETIAVSDLDEVAGPAQFLPTS